MQSENDQIVYIAMYEFRYRPHELVRVCFSFDEAQAACWRHKRYITKDPNVKEPKFFYIEVQEREWMYTKPDNGIVYVIWKQVPGVDLFPPPPKINDATMRYEETDIDGSDVVDHNEDIPGIWDAGL